MEPWLELEKEIAKEEVKIIKNGELRVGDILSRLFESEERLYALAFATEELKGESESRLRIQKNHQRYYRRELKGNIQFELEQWGTHQVRILQHYNQENFYIGKMSVNREKLAHHYISIYLRKKVNIL